MEIHRQYKLRMIVCDEAGRELCGEDLKIRFSPGAINYAVESLGLVMNEELEKAIGEEACKDAPRAVKKLVHAVVTGATDGCKSEDINAVTIPPGVKSIYLMDPSRVPCIQADWSLLNGEGKPPRLPLFIPVMDAYEESAPSLFPDNAITSPDILNLPGITLRLSTYASMELFSDGVKDAIRIEADRVRDERAKLHER